MSTRSWQIFIEDIVEAAKRIKEYTYGFDYKRFQRDRKTIDAVIRNLEIIGEASTHIPVEVQERHSEIPWGKMKGIRNILIHEYFGVDLEVVWETIERDLPPLQEKLRRLL